MNYHAHTSALLRSRIQEIIEQRASTRTAESSDSRPESGNVIVSHPPTPTLSTFGSTGESCAMSNRPFSTTEPFELAERIPLSSLPGLGKTVESEDDFDLILVTGESCAMRSRGERLRLGGLRQGEMDLSVRILFWRYYNKGNSTSRLETPHE